MFVEAADVTCKTDYGFYHPKMKAFFADVKSPGLGKTGVLALVATSPRVHAAGMNLFTQAAETLKSRVPAAVAIVVCGRGVFVASAETQPDPEELEESKDGCPRGFQRLFQPVAEGARRTAKKAYYVKQVQDAIQQIDDKFGLARPVIVFGYNLVGRSFSDRSLNRVLTHAAIVLQKGKSTADLRQTFMRGAGLTVEARARNGFGDGVRMLCVKEDYDVIMQMFAFTADVLRMNSPDNAWLTHQEYPRRYKPILETRRPHAKRKLRPTLEGAGMEIRVTRRRGSKSRFVITDSSDDSDVEIGGQGGQAAAARNATPGSVRLLVIQRLNESTS